MIQIVTCGCAKKSQIQNPYSTRVELKGIAHWASQVKEDVFITYKTLDRNTLKCIAFDLNKKKVIDSTAILNSGAGLPRVTHNRSTFFIQSELEDYMLCSSGRIVDTIEIPDVRGMTFSEMTFYKNKIFYSRSLRGWMIFSIDDGNSLLSHGSDRVASHQLSKFHFQPQYIVALNATLDSELELSKVSLDDLDAQWSTTLVSSMNKLAEKIKLPKNSYQNLADVIVFNSKVWVTSFNRIWVIDLDTGEKIASREINGESERLFVTDDNRLICFSKAQGTIFLEEVMLNSLGKFNVKKIFSHFVGNLFDAQVYLINGSVFFCFENISRIIKLNSQWTQIESEWNYSNEDGTYLFLTDPVTNLDKFLFFPPE